MKDRVRLFEIPLVSLGVTFDREQLDAKIRQFISEIKIYLPQIDLLNCDLEDELTSKEQGLLLVIILVSQPQLHLLTQNDFSLNEAAILILDQLEKLPQTMRLLAFRTFSVNQSAKVDVSDSDEKLLHLIKRNQKKVLNLILGGKSLSYSFPEMAPYFVDHTTRQIEFTIEYIHSEYFKIKLLSDSLSKTKRSKTSYLKIGNKMLDDKLFMTCGQALRSKPKKALSMNVFCFRDTIANNILLYHIT
jgi:hypothetical protein